MKNSPLDELLDIMRMLRDPRHGCPWDLQQDFRSIAPHTLEEAYEVVDAIENGDHAHLKNELGDLLFQVVFYAQLGKERGLFDFGAIINEITGKLLHRHPHVFPGGNVENFGASAALSPAQVESNWERIKQAERANRQPDIEAGAAPSLLDGVPRALPALSRAAKIQKRAASAGFDWQDARGVLDKLREEIAELEQAMADEDAAGIGDELGDLLFTAVNLARHLKQDPETRLRQANAKFEQRFRQLEKLVKRDGFDIGTLGPAELDEYWRKVKAARSPS